MARRKRTSWGKMILVGGIGVGALWLWKSGNWEKVYRYIMPGRGQGSTPNGATPDGATPDGTTPDGITPQGSTGGMIDALAAIVALMAGGASTTPSEDPTTPDQTPEYEPPEVPLSAEEAISAVGAATAAGAGGAAINWPLTAVAAAALTAFGISSVARSGEKLREEAAGLEVLLTEEEATRAREIYSGIYSDPMDTMATLIDEARKLKETNPEAYEYLKNSRRFNLPGVLT